MAGSLDGRARRVRRLEDACRHSAQSISRAALATLSDEDLDALEDVLEAGEWRDLRDTPRGRRAEASYNNAVAAVKRGEVPMNPKKKGAEQ